MNTNCITSTGAFWLLLAWCAASATHANPICPPALTLAEEIEEMDVVAFVKLAHIPAPDPTSFEEVLKARFEVIGIVKGDAAIKIGQKLELIYFGEGKIGDSFLVKGIKPPQIEWSVPLRITPRAMNYVRQLTTLPKGRHERLQFFLQHVDDEDELLASDSVDELDKADYAQIKALKPYLKHDQLVASIQNREVPARRRRLYLKMLGVCGSEKDVPLLESYLHSTNRRDWTGLDALIACYLTLKGESGVALVEELFLRNQESDLGATYCAILALRFHGNDGGVLKRERVVQAMRLMLKRPDLSDLVIRDLAAWEDWESSEEVFELFKAAPVENTWIRVPAYSYLRRCPTPRAKEMRAECEKIDANAVKRAKIFFPDAR